jgi:hypothetical protein
MASDGCPRPPTSLDDPEGDPFADLLGEEFLQDDLFLQMLEDVEPPPPEDISLEELESMEKLSKKRAMTEGASSSSAAQAKSPARGLVLVPGSGAASPGKRAKMVAGGNPHMEYAPARVLQEAATGASEASEVQVPLSDKMRLRLTGLIRTHFMKEKFNMNKAKYKGGYVAAREPLQKEWAKMPPKQQTEWATLLLDTKTLSKDDQAALMQHSLHRGPASKKDEDKSFFNGKTMLLTYYDGACVFKLSAVTAKETTMEEIVLTVRKMLQYRRICEQLRKDVAEMVKIVCPENWSWSFEIFC